ncbi:MAG: hypothetical protein JST08_03615 [Actinobacteria bacterium]|nr:hypothetical protein [Actinomycetota bacterium]
MSVPARLAAFAALLALTFGGAVLVGGAIDPTSEAETSRGAGSSHGAVTSHADEEMSTMDDHEAEHAHDAAGTATDAQDAAGTATAAHGAAGTATAGGDAAGVEGLAVSDGGYTFAPAQTFFTAGQPSELSFRILGPAGDAVRAGYELESERELHLIVVSRDGRFYRHLHPRRDAAGVWSTGLTLPSAGVYRAYADFQIDGERHVLGADLFAPGQFTPRPLPAPRPTASSDGYGVALAADAVAAGGDATLTFRVTQDGRPVADLQPYLGAMGHLVALREGDLAYLHVHPDETSPAPGAIRFMADFPSAGRYRLFLQFKDAAAVHTVAYTLAVPR